MRINDIFNRPPAVKRIVAYQSDEAKQELDFWIWMRSLQGIVNQTDPHLYLVSSFRRRPKAKAGADAEIYWLDWYKEKYSLPVEDISDADELLERCKDKLNGYLVYDNESVRQTMNVGITRAGLEGIVPVSADQEHWMTRHGIPKQDDLRGRWENDWDAAEWAIDELWPQCNRRLYGNVCFHREHWFGRSFHSVDYLVQNKGLVLDLPASRQRRRVLDLFRRVFAEGESPGAQMNWHCAYDQEKEFVAEAAKQGFMTLQTMSAPNLSVHAGVGDHEKSYVQPMPERSECKAEKGKIYVCFYNSDGDAASLIHSLQGGNWLAPERGSFKFGWGFLPLLVELMPGVLEYYNETKTDNDCFWGPSSGAAYTYTYLWPEEHAEWYLKETRRLLTQSGQNGCNMVNWNLWDWHREVEDDDAVRREQDILGAPGLVCGLGGSPYAKSYPDAKASKVHSVDIANVGRENIAGILKFADDCPTRPLFMFLFAQISPGIWEQLQSEMPLLAEHPEIEILSMDEFQITLADAKERGLVGDELYEKNDALAEKWLKKPGRHRLPIAEKVTTELAEIAHADPDVRRKHLAEAGWTDLVSRELESSAGDRERFLTMFKGRLPAFTEDEEPEAMFYATFITAWHVVRAAITSKGIYANHRDQCLRDFLETCSEHCDTSVFEEVFEAWARWEEPYTPAFAQTVEFCDRLSVETRKLRDTIGPDESEESFASWPPRSI
jgi:hypothetical protein